MLKLKTSGWPIHGDDEIKAVQEVLASGCTNYWTGLHGRLFEEEFAAWVGVKYAIAMMNGTVALEAALEALRIGPGDEVITSCRTFIASASCIVRLGATPVFADVDANSQNITAQTIEPCITAHTKAIVVVHLAGWPADMPAIMVLAKKHGLKVIEDCAQAHGASIKGQKVGSFGDVAAFSFCQDKIITTGGEGGMVVTNEETLWEKIWTLKDHGKNYHKMKNPSSDLGFKWCHDSFGTNWRMTEMQAVIGRLQLKKVNQWLASRKRNAAILSKNFKNVSSLRVTIPPDDINHAYYKYYLFINGEKLEFPSNRDKILKALHVAGIPCFVGSCSEVYREQAFVAKKIAQGNSKPIADQLGKTSLMFLVHPTLTEQDMQSTADKLLEVIC